MRRTARRDRIDLTPTPVHTTRLARQRTWLAFLGSVIVTLRTTWERRADTTVFSLAATAAAAGAMILVGHVHRVGDCANERQQRTIGPQAARMATAARLRPRPARPARSHPFRRRRTAAHPTRKPTAHARRSSSPDPVAASRTHAAQSGTHQPRDFLAPAARTAAASHDLGGARSHSPSSAPPPGEIPPTSIAARIPGGREPSRPLAAPEPAGALSERRLGEGMKPSLASRSPANEAGE